MKRFITLQWMLLLILPVFLFSCGSDDSEEEPEPLEPKKDGFYIYGTNTVAASDADLNARMARAVLDPAQGAKVDNMEGIYGKFLYIGANSTISFMEVIDEVATTFGAPGGGTLDSGKVAGNVLIKDKVIFGTLTADAPAIKVAEEGLYYAFANVTTDLFVLMKVKADMIGDATPLNWAAGTGLPLKSISKDSTVFEGKNIALRDAAGYRYRFNNGWHVYNDLSVVTLSSLGVPDYAEAWATGINNVGLLVSNIPNKGEGLYTVRLKYNAATNTWTEKKIKTGFVLKDYSETQMGLFGNAYLTAPKDTAAWEVGVDGYDLHTPEKDGTVYTWEWTVDLLEGREFIFLQDATWGGLQIDYLGATAEGVAIDNGDIVNAKEVGGEHPNYRVINPGTYIITLAVDAATDARTVTIVPAPN
ncbi:hypothetical protein [Parachryseolinea silvisoli]|uniref:hypothetical protein n=1 Tax=Parachryseolinea silvisoli TaxID=2873601 RepID=UPI002265F735|nr:hypothetical protein [Parachryseolinea silvisoli]MCD9015283.1 hypothetical protein [Parachryseolinea silvisoli]